MHKILDFLQNQEHLCAKVMTVLVVVCLFFFEYRGEWSTLPSDARTAPCQRMREHLDSFNIDRYAHARHFAYDMIQCLTSINDEVSRPLVYEVLLPSLCAKDELGLGCPQRRDVPHPEIPSIPHASQD